MQAFGIFSLLTDIYFQACDNRDVYFSDVNRNHSRGWCGRDRMVVGFTTNYAISVYHK
jgi:predicted RNA-binding Zn ribbon-like protein